MSAVQDAEMKEAIFKAFRAYDLAQGKMIAELKEELHNAYYAHAITHQRAGKVVESDQLFDRADSVRKR